MRSEQIVRLSFPHKPGIRDRPVSVSLSLLRVARGSVVSSRSFGHPVRYARNPDRWRVRLPAAWRAPTGDVAVTYRGGDGDFWAGIDSR